MFSKLSYTTSLRYAMTSLRGKSSSAPAAEAEAASTKTTSEASVPIVQSLLAAVLGVGTVSVAAFAIEAAAPVPAFDPREQRFDQSQFAGRFSRMLLACDPRLLFYSQEQVLQAKQLIDNHQQQDAGMDRALWEARRLVEAAVHPDTGEFIPRPFRMSGYVPYNGPINVAMVSAQSTMPLLFWSWVNQSQNALVNYFNRNASSPMSNQTLALSYGAAVGSALTVAFGLATLVQKRFEPAKAKQLMRYVAFPSAVVASSLNCYIVRSPEIDTGIPLMDAVGNDILKGETSQIAAREGVHSTTASRALLQMPVYFLPPLLLSTVGPFKRYLSKNPTMTVPLTTYLLLVSFGVGLPATVAIFPQISSIPASQVEERFQHLRDAQGKPHEVYYYNKGL